MRSQKTEDRSQKVDYGWRYLFLGLAIGVALTIGIPLSHGAATDDYGGRDAMLFGPANSINIDNEKNDNADLTHVTRRIFVGTGGTLVVVLAGDGSTGTYKNLPSGSFIDLRVRRVKTTGTTAADVVGEY